MTIYERMCADKVYAASVLSEAFYKSDYEDDDYSPGMMQLLDADAEGCGTITDPVESIQQKFQRFKETMEHMAEYLDDVADTLIEVGNGVTDEMLHDQADSAMKMRDHIRQILEEG